MRPYLRTGFFVAVVGLAFRPAAATTVRFDIVPTDNPGAASVEVISGSQVGYDLYAQVISDDSAAADNNGLSFFTVDIMTDLGVAQQPMSSFSDLIGSLFSIVQSPGTAQDDDILQIGGGQNSFVGGTAQAGIAAGPQRQLIGQGVLTVPDAGGTFSVAIGETSRANVFNPGSVTGAKQATLQVGSGFTIRVIDAKVLASRQAAQKSAVTGGLFVGLGLIAVLAAFLAFGPVAGILAILLFPLLFLLMLLNS